MRSPKPYIVERKSRRRTTPDSAPASIWGNLDLGAVLNDAQIASIKTRLKLTNEQQEMWPAVEAALAGRRFLAPGGTP